MSEERVKWEKMSWEFMTKPHWEEKVRFESRWWLAHFDWYLHPFHKSSKPTVAMTKAWLFEEDNEGSSRRDMFRLAAILSICCCNMTLWSSFLTTIDQRGEGKKVEGLTQNVSKMTVRVSFYMHIQEDVDKFVASSEHICLPIWMGAVRIRIQIAGENITMMQVSSPSKSIKLKSIKLICCEVKSCMFVEKASQAIRLFNFKPSLVTK